MEPMVQATETMENQQNLTRKSQIEFQQLKKVQQFYLQFYLYLEMEFMEKKQMMMMRGLINLGKDRQKDTGGMSRVDKMKFQTPTNGLTSIMARVLQERDPVPGALMMEQHLFPEECPLFLLLSEIVDWQKSWQNRWFSMHKKIENAVVLDKYFNHQAQDLPDQSHQMTTRTTTKIQLVWLRFSTLDWYLANYLHLRATDGTSLDKAKDQRRLWFTIQETFQTLQRSSGTISSSTYPTTWIVGDASTW
jgi:hypothetical protein